MHFGEYNRQSFSTIYAEHIYMLKQYNSIEINDHTCIILEDVYLSVCM